VINPFRTSSKLHEIFDFMSDGNLHGLDRITELIYGYEGSRKFVYRRRTASALRTIRRTKPYDVIFDGTWYQLRMDPVDGSPPADVRS